MSHEQDEPKDDTVCGEARTRFKRASEAEDQQRKAILDDKKFRAGDQWPEGVRLQREGGAAIQGQAAQPARPCLTIDRVSAPVRQVSNTVRSANFAINVMPNGHGADDETAEIFKGLLRRIQNDARADDPIDWAADGAAEGGIGWFRILTEYCHDQPNEADPASLFDQELKLGRVPNNLSVYCDPSAVRPTRSDAKFMFVTEDMPRDEFKRKYGEDKLVTLDEFRSTGDQDGWIGDNLVRVAEYWRCDYDKSTIYETANGVTSEKPEDKAAIIRSRVIFSPNVKWSLITACHELEKREWAGSRIPLIPVLGEEFNVDGKTIVRGVIRGAKDAQRMVNYMYSGAIESVALAPKAPWLIAEGQIEGHEQVWQTANINNYTVLPYKMTGLGGTPIPPPQRNTVEPPIGALVEMLARSEDAVKATTSIYDPSLGNTNPREKSGRAIMALQQQSEQSNSNYLDNVQRAMTYAGELLVEIAPKIYDRPGRVLRILGIDDQAKQVTLGPPPQQPGAPDAMPMAKGMAQFYDLSKGNYAVTVTVGKAWSTKREEGVAVLGELIAKNPQLLQVFGDLFFRDLDTPGAQEISERMKKMLPPQLQETDDGEMTPEQQVAQLTQQAQQLTQMLEMTTKELQAKTEVISTETIQAERDFKLKELEVSSRERIEYAKIEASLREEVLKAGFQAELIGIQAQIDALMQQQGLAAQGQQQAGQQAHDAAMQGREQAQELALTGAQMGHEQSMAEQQAAQQQVSE